MRQSLKRAALCLVCAVLLGGATSDPVKVGDPLIVDAAMIAKAARRKTLIVEIFAPTADNATGDGIAYIPVPQEWDAHNIVGAELSVVSAGTTGNLTVQVAICAAAATGNACSGTVSDVFSTVLDVDTGENHSGDSSSWAACESGGLSWEDCITGANDDLDPKETIRVDVDTIHTGTAAKGATLILYAEPE